METKDPRPRTPLVGLIVPPAQDEVPPEGAELYPHAVRFAARGLGLQQLTPDGYEHVIGRVEQVASELAGAGVDAIALMGTSLSFYRGAEFNDRLVEAMRAATALPATTMSTAVIDAMRALGVRRVAVGTAYADEVNHRLGLFLRHMGIEVASIVGLGLERVETVLSVTDQDLLTLGRHAFECAGERADALFISCGGLRTLTVSPVLEEECRIPVISSSPAGFWAAVRLVGLSGAAPGRGRMFSDEVCTRFATAREVPR